mmetsp:Transcript_35125/g.113280  ORF Transcript_35125/g.113280 Transcript_35125/m.113280 type:complete len:328 (+) Transcript_35125:458-1441(+)
MDVYVELVLRAGDPSLDALGADGEGPVAHLGEGGGGRCGASAAAVQLLLGDADTDGQRGGGLRPFYRGRRPLRLLCRLWVRRLCPARQRRSHQRRQRRRGGRAGQALCGRCAGGGSCGGVAGRRGHPRHLGEGRLGVDLGLADAARLLVRGRRLVERGWRGARRRAGEPPLRGGRGRLYGRAHHHGRVCGRALDGCLWGRVRDARVWGGARRERRVALWLRRASSRPARRLAGGAAGCRRARGRPRGGVRRRGELWRRRRGRRRRRRLRRGLLAGGGAGRGGSASALAAAASRGRGPFRSLVRRGLWRRRLGLGRRVWRQRGGGRRV